MCKWKEVKENNNEISETMSSILTNVGKSPADVFSPAGSHVNPPSGVVYVSPNFSSALTFVPSFFKVIIQGGEALQVNCMSPLSQPIVPGDLATVSGSPEGGAALLLGPGSEKVLHGGIPVYRAIIDKSGHECMGILPNSIGTAVPTQLKVFVLA